MTTLCGGATLPTMSWRVRFEKERCSMIDLEEAHKLLAAADRDLSALRGMADPLVFADEIAGFHAQQAAEKLLKAWLVLLGESYPYTHNLARLLKLLQEKESTSENFRELNEPDCCRNRKIRYYPDQTESRFRVSPSFPRKRESRCSRVAPRNRQPVSEPIFITLLRFRR